VTQHASLTAERWSRFSLEQQILMIGNEMHRTTRLLSDGDSGSRRRGYERVLRLTDLTVEINARLLLRRELLRWRDLAAALYVAAAADPVAHRAAFRMLLQLHPVPARQIPVLLD
jgi:hypothetical protein